MTTLEKIQVTAAANLMCLDCTVPGDCDEADSRCLFRILLDRPVNKTGEQKRRYYANALAKGKRQPTKGRYKADYYQRNKERIREYQKRYAERKKIQAGVDAVG